jgi:hypothetical protein
MEIHNPVPDSFDENQSLQVIREMIAVSQKKFQNHGILFILWGCFVFCLCSKLSVTKLVTISDKYNRICSYAIGIFVLSYTMFGSK